jgi:hypothetical protein
VVEQRVEPGSADHAEHRRPCRQSLEELPEELLDEPADAFSGFDEEPFELFEDESPELGLLDDEPLEDESLDDELEPSEELLLDPLCLAALRPERLSFL